MQANEETTMSRSPRVDPAWKHLGDLLVQRRMSLNPRYRNRRTFCDEKQIDYRVISDLESARRSNFSQLMITAIEVAYEIPAGSIQHMIQNPDLKELPSDDREPTPRVAVPRGVSLPDMEDWERAIWMIPELSPAERGLAVAAVRYAQDPKDEQHIERLFLLLLPTVLQRLPELLAQDDEPGENGTPKAG